MTWNAVNVDAFADGLDAFYRFDVDAPDLIMLDVDLLRVSGESV